MHSLGALKIDREARSKVRRLWTKSKSATEDFLFHGSVSSLLSKERFDLDSVKEAQQPVGFRKKVDWSFLLWYVLRCIRLCPETANEMDFASLDRRARRKSLSNSLGSLHRGCFHFVIDSSEGETSIDFSFLLFFFFFFFTIQSMVQHRVVVKLHGGYESKQK